MTEAVAQGKLAHKPNLKDLEMASDDADDDDAVDYGDEDLGSEEMDDEEEGESEIEEDIGKAGAAEASDEDSDDGMKGKKGRVVKDGGVYKAPKLNAVAFEDSKDRKKRLQAEY